MRDFEDSTLWRVSVFERMRAEGLLGRGDGNTTLLPSTLLRDLQQLESEPGGTELLEVLASCVRHREAALLELQLDGLVWPLTLFPLHGLVHSPRNLLDEPPATLVGLKLVAVEPAGVRPPGHWMHERVAAAERYRPLQPLLWALALHGPRHALLKEIGGTAAYRATPQPQARGLPTPGALGPALERLRRESVPLRAIAGWTGMSVERASRLLNALYLTQGLLLTRTHPAARAEPVNVRGWFAGLRKR